MNSIVAQKKIMSPGLHLAITTITKTAIWATTFPLVIGVFRFRQNGFGIRAIAILMAVALFTDTVLSYYGNSEQFAMYIPRVYTLVEFTAISLFFISVTSRKKLRVFMYAMFVPFCSVVVVDYLVGGILKRDDLSVGVECLIFILYSVITLYLILRDAEYYNILSTPVYWIICAILLYFGGTIFVYISCNYIASISRDTYLLLWGGVRGVFCILYYCLLGVGLWKAKESQ